MNDQNQFLVSLLLEDFKARWQELLNTSGEISTWTTIYYSALVITIAWVLGRRNKKGITDLFVSENLISSSLVISLALINVVYILGISIRTYQVQQIGLYLYEVIGRRTFLLTGHQFNEWEYWRREVFQTREHLGDPEKVRSIYYLLMTLLPTGVSGFILSSYLKYERSWRHYLGSLRARLRLLRLASERRQVFSRRVQRRLGDSPNPSIHFLNLFFVFVVIANIAALVITGILIFTINQKWRVAIREQDRIRVLNAPLTRAVLLEASDHLRPLRKLAAASDVDVTIEQYKNLLLEASVVTDEAVLLVPEGPLRNEFEHAIDSFRDAKSAWELSQNSDGYLPTENPRVQAWISKYHLQVDATSLSRLSKESALEAMFSAAREHVGRATSIVKESLEKQEKGLED
jgi:hypothetical protein